MNETLYSMVFCDLINRLGDGERVPGFAFDSAEIGKCHDNVYRFVALYPDHVPVRGWLLTGIANADGSPTGIYRIVCHSVVRRPNDNLIDVTPMDERDRSACVFLEHIGSDIAHETMRVSCAERYYPPV